VRGPFGFTSHLVGDVRYLDRRFDAWVEFDLDEVQRRAEHGLDSITDRRSLEALASLPLGVSIPRARIDPIVLVMLDAAPRGAVEHHGNRVRRRWRPALKLTGVVSEVRSLVEGVRHVAILASQAPRGVVVCSARKPQRSSMDWAAELGIGVAHRPLTGPASELLPPRPKAVRLGPVHWRLLETVFDEALRAGVIVPVSEVAG
jgi:hypothetical protein